MKLGTILENALACKNFDNFYYFIEYCLNHQLMESKHVDCLLYWMNMFRLSKTTQLSERLKEFIKKFLMNIYDQVSYKSFIEYLNKKEFNSNEYNELVDCLKYKIDHFYPKIEFIEFNKQVYIMDNGTFYDCQSDKVLFTHIQNYKVVDNKIFIQSDGLFMTYHLKYKKMKVFNYEYPLYFYEDFYLTKRNHYLYLLDYNHKKLDKMKIEKEYHLIPTPSQVTLYKEEGNDFLLKSYCLKNKEFVRVHQNLTIKNHLIWNKFVVSLVDYKKINRKDMNKTIINLIILYLLDHMKMSEITLKEIDYLYYYAEHLLKDVEVLNKIYENYQYVPSNTLIDHLVLFEHVCSD